MPPCVLPQKKAPVEKLLSSCDICWFSFRNENIDVHIKLFLPQEAWTRSMRAWWENLSGEKNYFSELSVFHQLLVHVWLLVSLFGVSHSIVGGKESQESRQKAGLIKVGFKIKNTKEEKKGVTMFYYFLCFNSDRVGKAAPSLTQKHRHQCLAQCAQERHSDNHTDGKAGVILQQLSVHDYLSVYCTSVKKSWIVWQWFVNKAKGQREVSRGVRSKGSVLGQTSQCSSSPRWSSFAGLLGNKREIGVVLRFRNTEITFFLEQAKMRKILDENAEQ